MEFEGRIWKDKVSSWYLAEIPFLDVMTQGKSKKVALKMAHDAVWVLLKDHFDLPNGKKQHVTIHCYDDEGLFGMRSSQMSQLFSLALIRQREKSGATQAQVASRLSISLAAYTRYESGKLIPSIEKYDRLLRAANPLRSRPLLVG